VQNATKIPDYERRIGEGHLATVRGCLVSEDDSRRAEIIEQLMCNYRAQVGQVDASLRELEADGLIRRSGDWIEVTDEGRPLVRAVAAAFDSYLPSSTATHVAAV
jgi:oxygen-independent coproporphyrinogen-3 oxidase